MVYTVTRVCVVSFLLSTLVGVLVYYVEVQFIVLLEQTTMSVQTPQACVNVIISDRTSSDLIRSHQNLIEPHQISADIIKYHQISPNIIRSHQMTSEVHHDVPTSSAIAPGVILLRGQV